MGDYGKAALKAHKMATGKRSRDPRQAWKQATSSIWPRGTPSQVKSCPRDAFLGLCQAGKVQGVPPGQYTRSLKNKIYAIKAVALLKAQPSLAKQGVGVIWSKVMGKLSEPAGKVHNQQMDVVLSLFQNGLIR